MCERQYKKRCLIIQEERDEALTVLQIQPVTVETLRGKRQPEGGEGVGGKKRKKAVFKE